MAENEMILPQNRLASIDALRGFDMFWIIGGGTIFEILPKVWSNPVTLKIKEHMEHVEWQGFRFEDLIFPLFLFIVGVVLPFSFARRLELRKSNFSLHIHIIMRSVILILLGLIFNGLLQFNFAEMRWPGVLQRIGLCYFFAAMIVLHTTWRTQAIVTGGILFVYWIIVKFIPVPEFGAGVLTPQGCLPAYIDRLLIPGKYCCFEYGDNEGLLSTFPAISSVLIGALTGHWLRSKFSGHFKTIVMVIAGVIFIKAGYLWGLYFPIIKVIWTSSYVLYAAGWSLLLLAVFYWVIDVIGFKIWAYFFIVIGMNAITIYFMQAFVNFDEIARYFFGGIMPHTGWIAPLVLPIVAFAARWLMLLLFYRHKIFFKV